MDYTIFAYIFLGILPSLIWLFYYLNEDLHPEPKRMILKIYLWGALITVPVFFVQIGLAKLIDTLSLSLGLGSINTLVKLSLQFLNGPSLLMVLLYWFIAIAFSEEIFKFLVIKIKVLGSPDLDEPLDIMLYMVIAALGFAAVENILYLIAPIGASALGPNLQSVLIIDFVRFIGAIFLHTLCSAVIGYSLAISFYEIKYKKLIVNSGILLAVLLHGLYDFSIITLDGYLRLLVPAAIILTLAFVVFSGFEKFKHINGECKIEPD